MSDTPEQQARETIDAQLSAAGWAIQNIALLNLHAARGVAVREMQSHGGPADYILFVDGKALGIVRKEFGKGNDFCKKVTYRASGKSEEIIKAVRTPLVS